MQKASPVDLIVLLILTFTTGAVDGIAFIGFHHVFIGNMTGNVLLLGVGLTGANGQFAYVRPLVALVCFMVGAVVGGRIIARQPPMWTTHITSIIGSVGTGILILTVLMVVIPDPISGLKGTVFASLLSVFMGIQAAVARKLNFVDVTTVAVTATIIGLATVSRLAGGTGEHWKRRVFAVALIIFGAFLGALSLTINEWCGLMAIGLLIVTVAALGHMGATRFTPSREVLNL